MNPESVTTGQFFSNFAAKHWFVLFSAISSIASGGYWAGKTYAESQSSVQQAELRGSLAQAQARLEVSQSKIEQLSTLLPQWQSAYQKLQTDFTQQQQTIASLTSQLGRSNNCAFIHEQIIATQRAIEHPGGMLLFSARKEDSEKEKERVASLQRRLESYTQQLSSCNK